MRLAASTTEKLGGMVLQGLGDERARMDSRRAGALSGVVVVSTSGKMKIMHIFILKIVRRFDGGDGFCSGCMRCSLRVYQTRRELPFCLESVSGYVMFPDHS